MRPTGKLVALCGVGVVGALAALLWDAALAWTVGWDVLLLIAWLIDWRWIPAGADLTVVRRLRGRLQLDEQETVVLEVRGPRAVAATLIDEPPPSVVEAAGLERPLRTRLIGGGAAIVEYPIKPWRRGDARFGATNVLVEGPLGLARRRVVLTATGVSTVQVLPKIGDLDRGALDPRLLMAELGIKPVRRPAEGTELESLRDALPEDELRRIDWRATARRGKPIARNYELERNHDVLLCIDTGRLMGAVHGEDRQTKLDLAVAAALRLAAVAVRNGDRVGVLAFDTEVRTWVPPDRGRAQLGKLLDATYGLQTSGADASYVKALLEIRRRQKKRALIVFLTDFVDADVASPMLDVLGVLARRHMVLFVALRDPQIREVADRPVEGLADAYRTIAAMVLDEARATVVEAVSAKGVRALDLVPEAVTAAAVRTYLALRAAQRI